MNGERNCRMESLIDKYGILQRWEINFGIDLETRDRVGICIICIIIESR